MIKDKLNLICRYIKYYFSALPKGGFGIHSPFVYSFVTDVIEESLPYYSYNIIEHIRQNLLRDKSYINVTDYGTGKSCKKQICEIAKVSSKNKKDSQLIFRIAVFAKAKNILELGTSIGTTTMYLGMSDHNSKIISLEGCPETANIAKTNLKNAKLSNVKIITGNIDNTLYDALKEMPTIDFAFFDANHQEVTTIKYFEQCLSKANKNSIFVFDDIHWSDGMDKAWKYICKNSKSVVTIDLFSMGIVFFNPELNKHNYKIKY